MSLPLINAAGINASEAAQESVDPPVQIIQLSALINGWGLNSAAINSGGVADFDPGPDEPDGDFEGVASSLRPVIFGIPLAQWGDAPEGTEAPAQSLRPVLFGLPELRLGVEPVAVMAPAQSMFPVHFGVPSRYSRLQLGPVPGLQPTHFGAVVMALTLRAQSLQPVRMGQHGLDTGARSTPLQPVRFGTPMLSVRCYAASLRTGRFGSVRVLMGEFSSPASSLLPVSFGVASLGGVGLRARTMCPVSFGRPVLDRGSSC